MIYIVERVWRKKKKKDLRCREDMEIKIMICVVERVGG